MRVLAFLIGVAWWPGIFGAPVHPRWWVIAIGLPIVSRLDPRRLHPFVLGCVAAGLGWSAVTLIWTPHLYGGAQMLMHMVLLALAMVAASSLDDIAPALEGLGWAIGVSSFVAAGQYFLGVSPVPQSSVPGGLFYNSEVLAEIAAPLFVWAALSRRFALAIVVALPLAICHSRAAVFAALVGLIAGWSAPRRWIKPLLAAVLIMLALLALVAVKAGSADHRLVLWGAALHSITLEGRGLGWWFSAHPFPVEEYAHSDVLQALVESGWAGALLIAAGGFILWRGRGVLAVRAAFACCAVLVCVSFPLHLPAHGFLVALLAGALAARRHPLCAAEPAGRASDAGDRRRPAAHSAGVDRCGGRGGEDVAVQPAYAQPARLGGR